MLFLLLIIVSYGALLLLLVPPSAVEIIITAALFILGGVFIAIKRVNKKAFKKNDLYLLIPAVVIASCLGVTFYNRWLPSSKVQSIAAIFHLPNEIMVLIASLALSLFSVCFLYLVLQAIKTDLSKPSFWGKTLLPCLVSSLVTVITAQIMINVYALSMGYFNLLWGVLIVAVVILFFYFLLGRIMPSIIIGSGIFMVISPINTYIYRFRWRLFEPVDIFSFGTAMNVAENYSLFPIPSMLFVGWGLFAVTLIILFHFQRKNPSAASWKRRGIALGISVICSVAVFFFASNLKTYHWHSEGAMFNGYVLDFVSKLKEISVPEPNNYSQELIAELADRYSADNSGPVTNSSDSPHIIVIMDEAFSDLSVLGEYSTDKEVMPFISSLKKNAVTGYALVSVFGGNTANSEYEFLTGNSLAWLSPNVVPYQQYMRSSTYSMVSYLKTAYAYRCIAMHPYLASGWNRPSAYQHLGFDECHFIEDFPQVDYVRDYVSDQEMFEYLIKTYETEKKEPLFIFGVTMQNHGDYDYSGENYAQQISLNMNGRAYPDAEQYLTLIHETDKAVEYLITYFQDQDEKVVIVFFGDHQPKLDEAFYSDINSTAAAGLDEQQKRYKVPFFIWANYDIEEKNIDCTSLNYLSSYVYETAGLSMPPYNRFLQDMEKTIPAINVNGYYSLASDCYLPLDDADEKESRWLLLYEMLRYNNCFDQKHRNKTLFPVLE